MSAIARVTSSAHRRLAVLLFGSSLLGACSSGDTGNPVTGPVTFQNNPCSVAGTLQLQVAEAARVDCGNGGTTLTLAGNGASYLVVAQFATDQGSNDYSLYHVASGSLASAALTAQRAAGSAMFERQPAAGEPGALPTRRAMARQAEFERALMRRAATLAAAGRIRPSFSRQGAAGVLATPPDLGSTRTFQVLSTFSPASPTWKGITAQLVYVGSNIFLYLDQAAPGNGFTADQLSAFGKLFDETLYPLLTQDFGPPSDVDQNGHVIMLLSPVVNADTPAADCASSGYVAGFFDADDFDPASNPHSNQGEVFYSVVPDPAGTVSCAHSVTELGDAIPSTFMHELQHLINYSRHVVINGGQAQSSWLDEGLSIIAEEMGSLYYEQRCPPPACRSNPAQLFPDSAEGFASDFLYDSYQYARLTDTASLTLHDDSEDGFGWRGGEWLLLRWLGDHVGTSAFKQVAEGSADGVTALTAAAGESFQQLMADWGLALYTDSLPGLPRATAPLANRFTSRNVSALWNRLYQTSGPSGTIPDAFPLLLFPITTDTSSAIMTPGSMSYWRLDTPANSPTVTIRFAAPGGKALAASLHPQLAVFRLPAGY
jgi:hypothetical protein